MTEQLSKQRSPIWDVAARGAQQSSEAIALRVVDANGQESPGITYGELVEQGIQASAFLHDLGLVEGSIVFSAIANTEVSVALSIGLGRLGAVWAPADEDLHLEQTLRLIDLYKPTIAFLSERKVATLASQGFNTETRIMAPPSSWQRARDAELPDEVLVGDDAMCTLYLTSGTTGMPKGVMSPCSLLRKMAGLTDMMGLSIASDTYVYFGSPAWVSYSAVFMWAFGNRSALVLGQGYKRDPFFDAVTRHRPAFLFCWPEVLVDFTTLPLEVQTSVASFAQGLVYGGARSPPSVLKALLRALPTTSISQAYGSTECGFVSALGPQDHAAVRERPDDPVALRRLESAGKCVRPVRIADEAHMPLPTGAIGSVQLFSDETSKFKGYFKNELATAGKYTPDGWFVTGDMGRLDEDGYLYIEGRDSETIVLLSGDNVYPPEVEAVIEELPDVIEAAVVKVVTDDSAICEVGAFVRVREGSQIGVEEVKEQCQKRLGQSWTHPTQVFLQTEPLLRNKNGKCLKPALSARASKMAQIAGKSAVASGGA